MGLVEAALALTLAMHDHNGLDPKWVLLAGSGSSFELDLSDQHMKQWLGAGTAPGELERREALGYFVWCAFDERFSLKVGKDVVLRGRYGLLGETPLAPDHGNATKKRVSAEATRIWGRWVSACLMAHVNMRDMEEVIGLRGNPPSAASRSALRPSQAEQWTLGEPEGVFAADLWTGAAPKGLDVWTFSLNLPDASGGPPAWRPANVNVGRTLDHDPTTPYKNVRIAAMLASYFAVPSESRWEGSPTVPANDPVYVSTGVCLDRPTGTAPRSLISCKDGSADRFPGIYVHQPRMGWFSAAGKAGAPSPSFGITVESGGPIQSLDCVDCIGPHPFAKAGTEPVAAYAYEPLAPRKVALAAGQRVKVTLALDPVLDAGLAPEPGVYTVMVRYRCAGSSPCVTTVMDRGRTKVWSSWPSTGGAFEWLHQSMVMDPGDKDLTVHLEGSDANAPELDSVAFYPGPPPERCAVAFLKASDNGLLSLYSSGRKPDYSRNPIRGMCKSWTSALALIHPLATPKTKSKEPPR